jgi:hypothetical protein
MNFSCQDYRTKDLQILMHHIYEYKKGLRQLVLHTMNSKDKFLSETLLKRKGIEYKIQIVNDNKINIFFGKKECIKIVNSFGKKRLNQFSDEEDFILGIMLGYDRSQQCDRYIKRKNLETIPYR